MDREQIWNVQQDTVLPFPISFTEPLPESRMPMFLEEGKLVG